jgi:hypothetical protein
MKHLILIILIALNFNAFAQDDKTVTLVVSGSGKTQEEAKQNALRSAIEQAFGTFISSKTEILNDNLVKDEIVSVSNGNIQKFDIISEVQIPEGGFATTLNATVSVTKLTSFVESKGVEVEFKGGMFAMNIKLQKLNEDAEYGTILNLCKVSKEMLSKALDYSVKVSEPVSKDGDSNLFLVHFDVSCNPNKNMQAFQAYFWKTIEGIVMTPSEVLNYSSLKKLMSPLIIGRHRQPIEGGYKIGIGVDSTVNTVNYLTANWPAAESGIQIGDKIISINGNLFKGRNDIKDAIINGNELTIEVQRNTITQKINIKPKYIQPQAGHYNPWDSRFWISKDTLYLRNPQSLLALKNLFLKSNDNLFNFKIVSDADTIYLKKNAVYYEYDKSCGGPSCENEIKNGDDIWATMSKPFPSTGVGGWMDNRGIDMDIWRGYFWLLSDLCYKNILWQEDKYFTTNKTDFQDDLFKKADNNRCGLNYNSSAIPSWLSDQSALYLLKSAAETDYIIKIDHIMPLSKLEKITDFKIIPVNINSIK